MWLSTIPEEILEMILLYVNTDDIQNVLAAVGRPGSEAFWRKICLQNGYRRLPGEDETWQDIAHRNINWVQGSYLKKAYKLDDLTDGECSFQTVMVRPLRMTSNFFSLTVNYAFGDFFLIGEKLLFQKEYEVLIMDAENPRILLQKLHGLNLQRCNLSRTKLLLRTSSSDYIVYHNDGDGFKELFVWNDTRGSFRFVLTDDYFVVLHTAGSLTVCLNNKEEYHSEILPGKTRLFHVSGCSRILNILILEEAEYSLRRFHLETREWLDDFLLFGGASMIHVPDVKINNKYVVSWCCLLEGRGDTMKIWSLENNARCVTLLTQLTTERVLWLLLESHYVIYSSTENSFTILNLNFPDRSESMVKLGEGYLGQTIISCFLVLSYTNGFKLVDFKKATYLREVFIDRGRYSILQRSVKIYYGHFRINEYFYVMYNVPGEFGGREELCVYDFRGKAQRTCPVIQREASSSSKETNQL